MSNKDFTIPEWDQFVAAASFGYTRVVHVNTTVSYSGRSQRESASGVFPKMPPQRSDSGRVSKIIPRASCSDVIISGGWPTFQPIITWSDGRTKVDISLENNKPY